MEETVASFDPTTRTGGQDTHLAKQDLATLDVSKLTPLSPEVISRQATINIGTLPQGRCGSFFLLLRRSRLR